MVKTLKTLLLWNQKAEDLESWYGALGTQVLPENDDPGLSLTYFMAMSILVHYTFVWENSKTMDFFRSIVKLVDAIN